MERIRDAAVSKGCFWIVSLVWCTESERTDERVEEKKGKQETKLRKRKKRQSTLVHCTQYRNINLLKCNVLFYFFNLT